MNELDGPVAPPELLAKIKALSVNGAPLDLEQSYVRKELASIIGANIDAYAVAAFDEGFRNHLGASLIGDDCVRKIWYGFRWMARSKPDGRMQRLFQRGHLEEQRFLQYLRGIGFTVWDVNPETGKQFRCDAVNGHFGGSLDSIIKPPAWYMLSDDILFLGEFKTKGTGRGFEDIRNKGIMLANPQHYDQMVTYGMHYGYKYACYFVVNKNDDDLTVEIVPLNWKRAEEAEQKASFLISQQTPPPKISLQETHWKCKTCECLDICHRNAVPMKNCRSCQNAVPINEGNWGCNRYGVILTADQIKTGCDTWQPIQ